MSLFFFNLKLKFLSLLTKKPNKKLRWNKNDLEKGKKWAKTQPHPFKKGKTLWDLCNHKSETVLTIEDLNKFIFNEI